MRKGNVIAIITCCIFSFGSFVSEAKGSESLNVIPAMKKRQGADYVEGKLSNRSKKVLNQIYKNQKSKRRASSKKSKLSIERMTKSEINLEDYDLEEGEGRFDVVVKKPSSRLEKKYDLYDKAHQSLASGQYEVAIVLYESILKKYHKDEFALIGLASTYHRLGDLKSARMFYIKALELFPNNMSAVNNFLILLGQESPGESLDELLKLDRVFHNNHVLKAQISYLYARQGNYEESLKYINTALRLKQDSVRYLYNKAVIMDHLGDVEGAKEIYNAMIGMKLSDSVGVSVERIRNRIKIMGDT